MNNGDLTSIEEVYHKVEAEKQRRSVMVGKVSRLQSYWKNGNSSVLLAEGCLIRPNPSGSIHIVRKIVIRLNFLETCILKGKTQGKSHGERKVIAIIENSSHESSTMEKKKKML